MTDQSLALREAPTLPSTTEWQTIVQMAAMLVPTGYLPSSIKTAEQAVLIILKGRELNIPPLYALSNIVVVQGKPTCSAELMLALVYRDHGDRAVIVEESTAEVCRVTYRRRGWDRARSFGFTIADARTAELAGKGTWKQYPQAMLRARCISAVARLAFPDSIAGMYTPEELGADVRVSEDGAIEVATAATSPPPPPAEPVTNGAASARVRSARMQAVVDEMDAAVADGATTDIVDPEQAFADPPAVVPGDDVDQLTGEALAEACRRLDVLLKASGVPVAPYPKKPASAAAWRAWWRTGQATLAAIPRPVAAS